jgi:hypothetical protein
MGAVRGTRGRVTFLSLSAVPAAYGEAARAAPAAARPPPRQRDSAEMSANEVNHREQGEHAERGARTENMTAGVTGDARGGAFGTRCLFTATRRLGSLANTPGSWQNPWHPLGTPWDRLEGAAAEPG